MYNTIHLHAFWYILEAILCEHFSPNKAFIFGWLTNELKYTAFIIIYNKTIQNNFPIDACNKCSVPSTSTKNSYLVRWLTQNTLIGFPLIKYEFWGCSIWLRLIDWLTLESLPHRQCISVYIVVSNETANTAHERLGILAWFHSSAYLFIFSLAFSTFV